MGTNVVGSSFMIKYYLISFDHYVTELVVDFLWINLEQKRGTLSGGVWDIFSDT